MTATERRAAALSPETGGQSMSWIKKIPGGPCRAATANRTAALEPRAPVRLADTPDALADKADVS